MRAAVDLAEFLAEEMFPDLTVRLLHGQRLERIVRVNVGTREENDIFLAALRNVLR